MKRDDATGAPVIWWCAVAAFLLAGSTGSLFRFGLVWQLPFGLQFEHVRHAHSHLMYFGWTTPAIMALIAARMLQASRASGDDGRSLRPAGGYGSALAAWLLGLATYPAFLLAGYDSVPVLGRELPVAAILSGLNLFAWYGFAAWYVRARRRLPATSAVRFWDAGVFFLCLSSLGAWGRSALQMGGVGDPVLASTAVHFFLTMFAEGWLLFAVLGFLVEDAGVPGGRGVPALERLAGGTGASFRLVWIAVPLASLAGSSLVRSSPAWAVPVGVSGVLVALLLGDFVVRRWSGGKKPAPVFLLGFLAVKALMQLGTAVPPIAAWGERAGLHIVYLHVVVLGVAGVGLAAAARNAWGARAAPSPSLFGGAVLLLLVGMIATTSLWPGDGGWNQHFGFAAVTSLAPVAAMAIAAAGGGRRAGSEASGRAE